MTHSTIMYMVTDNNCHRDGYFFQVNKEYIYKGFYTGFIVRKIPIDLLNEIQLSNGENRYFMVEVLDKVINTIKSACLSYSTVMRIKVIAELSKSELINITDGEYIDEEGTHFLYKSGILKN